MKFRRLVLVFLFLLLIVAWFTKPGLEDFNKLYERELRNEGAPVIELKDRFLYTTVDISFYAPARIEAAEPLKAVTTRKEEYLGLFGRFWKL